MQRSDPDRDPATDRDMTKTLTHLVTAPCVLLACASALAQQPTRAIPALEPVTFTGTVPQTLREQFTAQKEADAKAAKAKADAAAKSPATTSLTDSSGVRPVEAVEGRSNLARTSLEFRELKRVESFVADIGPLGTSGRQQDASLRLPNDFDGLYQIPKDADTPYAGWFARRRGGLTAVFPKGDYNADKNGLYAVVPANTTYIMGAIPTGDALQLAQNRAEPSGMMSTRQPTNVSSRIGGQLTTRISDDDGGLLMPGVAGFANAATSTGTVWGSGWGLKSPIPDLPRAITDEQHDLASIDHPAKSAAMDIIFSGGLARSVRLAELGRAAGIMRAPAAGGAEPGPTEPANPAVTTGQR